MKYLEYFLEFIIFIISTTWTKPSALDVLNINIDTVGYHEDKVGQKDYHKEAEISPIGIEYGEETAVVIDREEDESLISNSCECAKAGRSLTSYLHGQQSPSDYLVAIVGGHVVYPKYKYPYQVHFTVAGRFGCGGTIINKRYVLTAMHCFFDDNGNALTETGSYVVVGEHNYKDGVNEGGQHIEVARFIKRNDYYSGLDTTRNDIAILELKTDIKFSDHVKPACLPTDDTKKYEGKRGILTGWGGTLGYEPGDDPKDEQVYPNQLKETSVKILDLNDCDQKPFTDFDPLGTLCAHTTQTGPCLGDSGGPLVVVEDGVYVLVGVISFGFGCATEPSAYTRVSHYLQWIVTNTRSGQCSG